MERVGLQRIVAGLFVGAACALSGCSSSSTSTREDGDRSAVVLQDENTFVFHAKVKREQKGANDKRTDAQVFPPGVDRDKFLLEVVSYLGVRYSYGGFSKKGIDCSGFVYNVFRQAADKELPRTTSDQFRYGANVDIQDLQFGDLVFFNTTGRAPSHVGIFIEDDVFAHASVVEGVTLSSLENAYYKKRFIGARRVFE